MAGTVNSLRALLYSASVGDFWGIRPSMDIPRLYTHECVALYISPFICSALGDYNILSEHPLRRLQSPP